MDSRAVKVITPKTTKSDVSRVRSSRRTRDLNVCETRATQGLLSELAQIKVLPKCLHFGFPRKLLRRTGFLPSFRHYIGIYCIVISQPTVLQSKQTQYFNVSIPWTLRQKPNKAVLDVAARSAVKPVLFDLVCLY